RKLSVAAPATIIVRLGRWYHLRWSRQKRPNRRGLRVTLQWKDVASWCRHAICCEAASHQRGAAIDDQDLASAEALAHQVEIGFGNLRGFADMADRQPGRDLPVERLAIRLRHGSPERRLHRAGRNDVDANR